MYGGRGEAKSNVEVDDPTVVYTLHIVIHIYCDRLRL
jgi:hypothetical protein